jgi:hypothetical protein
VSRTMEGSGLVVVVLLVGGVSSWLRSAESGNSVISLELSELSSPR